METPRNTVISCAIAVAILAMPAAAAAESVVPPENSAATQYTEAIPTGGGQKDAGKAGHHEKLSPADVLGSHKAQKLNAQGPQGKAAAEVVAATAPSVETTAPAPEPTAAPDTNNGGGNGNAKPAHPKSKSAPAPKQPASHATDRPPSEPARTPVALPSGSSGLGEVLAQATGSSSSGQLGALLPLLIVATVLWSVVYVRRQRRHNV
jgi:hypothetical protein